MPGWDGRRRYSREFHRNKAWIRKHRSGGYCEVIENGARCTRLATSCDHITPQARGGGDEVGNLQDICTPHHQAKTSREAAEGRALRRGMARRPSAPHPGVRPRKDY